MTFHATRLAPSPTGALHLGHVRTFLVTWWMAKQLGAKIFMRMEDLDAGRAKPESIGQAYDDLRWLGMTWDPWVMPDDERGTLKEEFGVRSSQVVDGAVVQSRRVGEYERALETLWQGGFVYPCTCSRAEIVASVLGAGNAPHEGDAGGGVRYPGTCREVTRNMKHETRNVRELLRELRSRTGRNVCWRLRVRGSAISFDDRIAGRQSFDVAADAGDFPLTRFVSEADVGGLPAAYQLACVVDDHAMGIDCVVRGDDLLSSTPRQMLVYEALGWQPPTFAHVPLVIGADRKRLAKRHGESRIAQFRQAGVSAERIIGWAAWRSGQLETPREISAAEVSQKFDLKKLNRERSILGSDDLNYLQ